MAATKTDDIHCVAVEIIEQEDQSTQQEDTSYQAGRVKGHLEVKGILPTATGIRTRDRKAAPTKRTGQATKITGIATAKIGIIPLAKKTIPTKVEVKEVIVPVTDEVRDASTGSASSNGNVESQETTTRQTDSNDKEEASSKNNWTSSTRVIEISVNGDTGEKFFQIVIDQPTSASQSRNEESMAASSSQSGSGSAEESFKASAAILDAVNLASVRPIKEEPVRELREYPLNCPTWATKLKQCEEIGNSYRGYVESEAELDVLLTFHRQQTGTTWGTRQSPSAAKESKRLMWKSNYVPYDGMPFLNLGSRAIVMECQYGPRRKGGPLKRSITNKKAAKGSCTCPARIYVKKVRKFPDFQVDTSPEIDKMTVKRNMDKVFQIMKEVGVDEIPGVERYYVQLPTSKAHEYHMTPDYPISQEPLCMDSSKEARLHPELSDKIRELVANGEINAYTIRQVLRAQVTQTMFAVGKVPERRNLYFFPTIIDIKNHVLLAISAIEKGELEAVVPVTITDARAITEPPPSSMTPANIHSFNSQLWESSEEQDNSTEMKPASSKRQMWPTDSSRPQTHSVTVTLTQNPEEGGSFISQVETHLSDGTTYISDSLSPETARLLSQINQHCQEVQQTEEDDPLDMNEIVSNEPGDIDQSGSLLQDQKPITEEMSQSETIIDTEKNDPTLSQSSAMMGLSDDTSSDEGNNQSETLLETGGSGAQPVTLLETPNVDMSSSGELLDDAGASIDQSKHLLDSDPIATDQPDPLLQESEEMGQSNTESMEAEELLLRTANQLADLEEDSPVRKLARYDV
ncbi:calcium-responsive transcription factor-like [Asterias rubens]|uniref:calcium-responsive transcription factor-like n=1 Tax=Asterias rubens TaxID=7604 RepID=UPI00145516A1|nr:calcium-responsive transcription factor-like [Asterias rubens]XP_033629585.1 calcium-responsive transcription factor-like [Asterias rubens]XP_033629586.1 calcium-responsive transcription factor-like [Asterias rubens]XP_033629587.1 calcium-responsive transcription factor-like [Asterias rubens]